MAPLVMFAAGLLCKGILVTILLCGVHASDDDWTQAICYYPDGSPSEDDGACSQDGGACCPSTWYCLSNGLCQLPGQRGENAYERHSCTHQDWNDPGCPNMCSYGKLILLWLSPCFFFHWALTRDRWHSVRARECPALRSRRRGLLVLQR